MTNKFLPQPSCYIKLYESLYYVLWLLDRGPYREARKGGGQEDDHKHEAVPKIEQNKYIKIDLLIICILFNYYVSQFQYYTNIV